MDHTDSGLTVPVRLLMLLLIFVVYIGLRMNLRDIPLVRDEGAFGYVGQVINAGGLPYRDAADHKPPLVHYMYAVALHFVEPTASGIHLFAFCINFMTLIALFFAAWLLFNSMHVGLWTAVVFAVFTSASSVQGFSATVALLMLLPMSLSLLFAVLALRRPALYWLVLSGAFGALACWIKPVAGASVLTFLLLLMAAWRPAGSQERLPTIGSATTSGLLWLAGGIGASLFVVAPFVWHGLWRELVYWTFEHNLAYVGQGVTIGWNLRNVGGWLVSLMVSGEGIPVVLAFAGLLALFRVNRWLGIFVTGFLILSVAGTVPGHNYPHYFMQWAPAVAIAAGWGIAFLLSRFPRRQSQYGAAVLIGAVIVGTPLAVQRDYYWRADPHALARAAFGANPFPESVPVAAWLRENARPDDQVFVYGSEAQILFLSGLRSPTRHILMYPLFRDFAKHREFQREAWDDLQRSPPAYIVPSTVPASFSYDGRADMWFYSKMDEFIKRDYRLIAWVPVTEWESALRMAGPDSMQEISRYRFVILIYERRDLSR